MIDEATIEKLKTTWMTFGGLTKEEQKFLKEHKKNVLLILPSGDRTLCKCQTLNPRNLYRLSPDFQLPKERWFFNTRLKRVVPESSYRAWESDWIEITSEQKAYLETKPEPVDGYDWVLMVPNIVDRYFSIGLGITTCLGKMETVDAINGFRWTLVPKQEEKDGEALINGQWIKSKVRM